VVGILGAHAIGSPNSNGSTMPNKNRLMLTVAAAAIALSPLAACDSHHASTPRPIVVITHDAAWQKIHCHTERYDTSVKDKKGKKIKVWRTRTVCK
jgi:hypothetical protein